MQNNLQEIEKQLDQLEKANNLYSNEAIQLIEKWVVAKSSDFAGVSESLNNQNIEEDFNYYKIYGNSEEKEVDVLVIVLHGGLKLPSNYSKDFAFSSWKNIAQTILDNHDIGVRWLTQNLISNLNSNNFTYKIFFYDYSRVAADVNRLFVENQIVDTPYRGEGLWKTNINKKEISENIVDPFFNQLEKTIKQINPKFIFHPHTYDAFGGGKASNGHEVQLKDRRPASMIFNYYNLYRGEAYGKYSNEKNARFYFMKTEENLEKAINSQKNFLSQILGIYEEIEVTVDYPYTSPPQLPGLIHTWTKVPQLILENRKDLFKTGHSQIYRSLINICDIILDK